MSGRRRTPWWVVASDIAVFNASMVAAYWLRYELEWFREISYFHTLSAYLPFALLFTVLMRRRISLVPCMG